MNRVLRRTHLAVLIAIGMQAGCVAKSRAPADPVPLSELASQISAAAHERPMIIVGESSHGVEEFGRLKLELVRELHRRGHARLILLESPFAGSFGVSPLDSTRTATEYLNSTTYAVWHTEAYSELVQYLRDQASMGDTIHWVCIDPNTLLSGARLPLSQMLGSTFTGSSDSDRLLARLAPLIDELHSIETSGSKSPADIVRARSLVQAGTDQLSVPPRGPVRDSVRVGIAVARALLDSYGMWISAAQDTDSVSRLLLRDRRMARMVELARKDLHPNSPTVLLTHNWHARRHAGQVRVKSLPPQYLHASSLYSSSTTPSKSFVSLGELLTRESPDSVYVIGLYFDHGATTLNNRSFAPISPAKQGSVEKRVLEAHPGGGVMSFISQARRLLPAWWEREQSARYWGLWEEWFVPAQQYDGVVVVPRASCPRYTDSPAK